MTTLIIRQPADIERVTALLAGRKLPVTVTVVKGEIRTDPQNRLQWMWMNEAAQQLQDDTPQGYQAYCKLHFGIPILRAENEAFREKYDEHIRPMPYEQKLALMSPPFDFSVTRIMTKDQIGRYLNAVWNHFSGLGVRLTDPEGLMNE